MSLFGSLGAGVSGLVANSSAMGAIADNITNVNTTGYKKTKTEFQTLMTKQTSVTFYSAGGVQSRPFAMNDVQGLLEATTSQTDFSISGAGMFVVNEASRPGVNDQFMFTRAGSFFKDDEGFLKNTSGHYLQAWPVDALGNIILPPNSTATLTNQNIISTDFLQTVNLNRVGGTATETSTIAVGANLPANAAVADSHTLDIQFFNSLGNTMDVRFDFTKTAANQWDLTIEPPSGAAVTTLHDAAGGVYASVGQLEFGGDPATWASGVTAVTVNGVTYTYDTPTWPAGATLAQAVTNLRTAIDADAAFTGGGGDYTVALKAGNPLVLVFGNAAGGGGDYDIDITNLTGTGLATGTAITRQGLAPSIIGGGAPFQFTILDKTVAGAAIVFNAEGLPQTFNVDTLAVTGFSDGAGDMDNTDIDGDGIVDIARIALDFGTAGEANGLTQYGAAFTPTFIQQNGARFGNFAGLTIDEQGLMTAIFDNGELRPIFKVPVATFVNPSGLEGKTGNVWIPTSRSGDPTLRVANAGPAGSIQQASLEASTVDIGEEFTDMIMVQRAYTAATRIIRTADQMLEELVNTKR